MSPNPSIERTSSSKLRLLPAAAHVERWAPHVITTSFNGSEEDIGSIEALGLAFDRYDDHAEFELWLSVIEGPSMCMLQNGEHAFLMYLRFPGDSGYVSGGSADVEGHVRYKLSNGQVDEYPQSWCVPIEQWFKALAYFFVNDGQRPAWVAWHESQARALPSGA